MQHFEAGTFEKNDHHLALAEIVPDDQRVVLLLDMRNSLWALGLDERVKGSGWTAPRTRLEEMPTDNFASNVSGCAKVHGSYCPMPDRAKSATTSD